MASQAQLELQIDTIQAEIASAEANLAALREAGDDPGGEAELESYISQLNQQLDDTTYELNNINTVFYENNGTGSTTTDSGPPLRNPPTTDAYQGPSRDDEGNLLPGWMYEPESGKDVYVGNGYSDSAVQASAAQSLSSSRGISASLFNTRSNATSQDQANAYAQSDWRVRLQLAPGATYLYKGSNPGILSPLIKTQGVLFPYTPSINVNYAATYDGSELTHSNYKIYQYKGSSVDNIQITCDFTAQDTFEANYLLAVIHFFRSVTKMFYGQDQNPVLGTPPPLCYLTGMGSFQFDRHPLALTGFNYQLPNDVDYIQADNAAMIAGMDRQQTGSQIVPRYGSTIITGGLPPGPQFNNTPTGSVEPTYVPTKMQLSVSAIPIVSRNDISKRFSLENYGSGSLLRGSKNNGAGIW